MNVFKRVEDNAFGPGECYIYRCPACECDHYVRVNGPHPVWTWNSSMEKPTLQPSVRVSSRDKVCHYMMKEGRFEYCTDSTHKMAGQTIDMVPYNTDI